MIEPMKCHSLSTNERTILSHIHQIGPMTRADLMRLTGLTAQSVSRIVRRLADEGLLRALGRQRLARGQPGVVYDIDDAAGFSIGISLQREEIAVALLDLKGARMQVTDTSNTQVSAEGIAEKAATLARRAVADAGLAWEKAIGIGLSVPGYFLPGGRHIVPPPPLVHLAEHDLAATLEDRMNTRVWLENDGAAAAIGESLLGDASACRDFLYVFLDYGIGGGLILDGRLHRGAFGNAAELGLLAKHRPEPRPSLEYLLDLFEQAGVAIRDIHELRAFGDRPHAAFEQWLETTGPQVGAICLAATSVADPERIVLGGRIPIFLLQRLAETIRIPGGDRGGYCAARPEIVVSPLGFEATVIGAASLPLKALLYA